MDDIAEALAALRAARNFGDADLIQAAEAALDAVVQKLNLADRVEAGKISTPVAAAMGAGRAGSFGTMDELGGAAAAAWPGGRGYTDMRDLIRQAQSEGMTQHPLATLAGGAAGAVLPGAGLSKLLKPFQLAHPVGRGTTLGGVMGALQGAGEGEGGFAERGTSAAIGGGLGAVLGGGAGKVGQKFGQWFRRTGSGRRSPTLQALNEAATPEEALIAEHLGLPVEQVRGRVGEQVVRSQGGVQASPVERAAIEARRQAAITQRGAPQASAAGTEEALPTFGNLAIKPGGVVEEVVADLQRRGPGAASEILKRGAGTSPATQPPNTLQELLRQAGEGPFAATAAEAGQRSGMAAMRRAAEEAARNAFNLVFEATGDKAAATAAARRAAGMASSQFSRPGGM